MSIDISLISCRVATQARSEVLRPLVSMPYARTFDLSAYTMSVLMPSLCFKLGIDNIYFTD